MTEFYRIGRYLVNMSQVTHMIPPSPDSPNSAAIQTAAGYRLILNAEEWGDVVQYLEQSRRQVLQEHVS